MSDGMIAVLLGKFSNLSYFGGRRGGNIPLPHLTRLVICENVMLAATTFPLGQGEGCWNEKCRAYGISREGVMTNSFRRKLLKTLTVQFVLV